MMWSLQAFLYKHCPRLLNVWLNFTLVEWVGLVLVLALMIS